MENVLCFKFENPNETSFIVKSCGVSNLTLQGVIFSPGYDLVIYLIDSDSLKKKEELFFSIIIEILVECQKIKRYNYKLTTLFSKEKYFSRFSGLFDEAKGKKFTVNVTLNLKNTKIPEIKINTDYPQHFNFIELESINGKNIYDKKEILDKKDIAKKIEQFKESHNFFISFNGTEEIIGPFNNEQELKMSLIKQHCTHIIPVPKEVKFNNSEKLFFFVEILAKNEYEFFGIFPSSVIKKSFGSSYSLSINYMKLDPKIDLLKINDYPSGTIIYGTLKR